MENVDAFEQVREFVRKEVGPCFKNELTRETRVEDDLKITGDDAIEFLSAFCEQYGINSDEFVFTKYFTEEGLIINTRIIGMWLRGEKIPELFPFTLHDLEKAILIGKLV